MPIYEYTCGACKKSFEELVRTMGAEPVVKCPECGSDKTVRALSVFAVNSAAGRSASSSAMPPSCGRCGGAPGSCQS